MWNSGTRPTTQIGYVSKNNRQKVHGHRNVSGTDHGQTAYKLECLICNNIYGANGSDIFQRKCPSCQDGMPGIDY